MCSKDGRKNQDWVCGECASSVAELHKPVSAQNPVLGRFLNDTLQHGINNPLFTRQVERVVSHLLEKRVDALEKYHTELSGKLHHSCVLYWEMFGKLQKAPDTDDKTCLAATTAAFKGSGAIENSTYVFPGRPRFRNAITFDEVDKQACIKNYFKGRNSPASSLLTVQCACSHPKIMGFVIIHQCESISAALSSLVTHFPIPPRNIWYDNACNTYDSGMLQMPWLLRSSRLLVDRFHYTGHNCSNIFNGNQQNELDKDRSVAAEVINSIINKGTGHISYLDGNN